MSTTHVSVATGDVVRCYCGEPPAKLTSHTSSNPNRDFFTCRTKRCKMFSWADLPTPQSTSVTLSHTETSLKRRNPEDSGTQGTPSKRPRPSVNDEMPFGTPARKPKVLEQYPGGSQQKQPATPSRTPQQKQRCMADIMEGLSQKNQSATPLQVSVKSTPSKPENWTQGVKENMAQQRAQVETDKIEDEDEFDMLLNQEEDPFGPVTGGPRTPPPTAHKGKTRSLNPLQDETFELAESSTQCRSNTSPADEVILTADELAKDFEQRFLTEVSKNARLEMKIKCLESQINALRKERE